jgi:hypothetical protein
LGFASVLYCRLTSREDETGGCEVIDRDNNDERQEQARRLRYILKAMGHGLPKAAVDQIKTRLLRLDLIERPLRRSSSS